MQRAVRAAVQETRISKTAACQAFRHSSTRFLLERGQDRRTIKELLGHMDVITTMAYAHVQIEVPTRQEALRTLCSN